MFKKILFYLIAPIFLYAQFTIMLEPAGDAKHAGREIDDCFERGITLQFAENLKKKIEQEFDTIRVILSRFAGESLEPLQNANFANRLNVDLYLSFHFYHETESKPNLFIYYFVCNPITDYWDKKNRGLSLIPYDKAHCTSINQSKNYAEVFLQTMEDKKFSSQFEVKGLYAFPFKPLIGLTMPAIAIEASLKHKEDWQVYSEPIIQALKKIF